MADCRKCKFGEVDFEGNIVCTDGDVVTEICYAEVEDECEVFVDKANKKVPNPATNSPALVCCSQASTFIKSSASRWVLTVMELRNMEATLFQFFKQ